MTMCKLRDHELHLSLAFAKHKHPRLWLWNPTQRFRNTNSPVCDSKTTLKGLDHQHLWWLEKVATSTIPDLEILQVIIPVEDMRELLRNPKIQKRHTLLSLKNLIKTCLGFPLYTRRSRPETLILFWLKLLFGLN